MKYLSIDYAAWERIDTAYHFNNTLWKRDYIFIILRHYSAPDGMRRSRKSLSALLNVDPATIGRFRKKLFKLGLIEKAGDKRNGITPIKPTKRLVTLCHLGSDPKSQDIYTKIDIREKKKEVSFEDTLPSSETKEQSTVKELTDYQKLVNKIQQKQKQTI